MDGNTLPKKSGITASALKTIALVTMLIDHLGMTVVYELEQRYLQNAGVNGIISAYMRAIGRIAFILYAFLLVEGFVNTSDRRKYVIRLLAGAVISEIPFDLAGGGKWFDPWDQNIFFTLAIGFCTIWVLESLKENRYRIGFGFLTVFAGLLLAEIVRCDYGCMGVGLIVVFYLFRWRSRLFWVVLAETFFGLIIEDMIHYMIKIYRVFSSRGLDFRVPGFADLIINVINSATDRIIYTMPGIIAALLLIMCYRGVKGRQLPKAFYYLFYPVHLALLYLLMRVIFY